MKKMEVFALILALLAGIWFFFGPGLNLVKQSLGFVPKDVIIGGMTEQEFQKHDPAHYEKWKNRGK